MISKSQMNCPWRIDNSRYQSGRIDSVQKEEDKELQRSLELFDFSKELPSKADGTIQIFYNNCNGLEINPLLSDLLQRKRDKKQYKYLQEIENPTKLDRLLRQFKAWEIDLAHLSEVCVAWDNIATRRAIRTVMDTYDKTACWVGSSSAIKSDNCYKAGGTAILVMNNEVGWISDKGADPWRMGRWSYVVRGSRKNNGQG